MQVFSKLIGFISKYIGILASIALTANMAVVVYSVMGRVVFSKPLLGIVDMVAVIFALTSAFSFCYTETQNGHVRMDLLIQKLPRIGKIVVHTITGIVGMTVLTILMVSIYYYASKALAANNITMTIDIPYFPFVMVTAISLTFFLIAMIYNFIRAYDEWRVK